jgi:hypothetical protein
MDRLRVSPRARSEAELCEHFQHRGVSGQDLRSQFPQAGIASDLDEVVQQDWADTASLPGIDDHEGHLGSSGLEDNVSATSDDYRSACFLGERDERDMILEINIHEEGTLLLREAALHDEKATLEGLCAGSSDRSEHVGFILRSKRSDFDLAAVA